MILLVLVVGILLLLLAVGVLVIFLRRRSRRTAPASARPKKQARQAAQPAAKDTAPGKAAPARPARPRQAEKPQPPVPAPKPEPAEPPSRSPLPPAPESGDKIRILIVDDNPDTRDNVSRLLYFEKDMEVIGQATNGRQGIEMAMALKPHIILMDINMPDMDGITATQELSVKAPYSQVIIITVQNEPHYMKRAMAAGARDFQPKPFTAEELVSCIRRVYKIGEPIYRQLEATQAASVQAAAEEAEAASADENRLMVAVYSPKGGIGVTMLASNLAVALQQIYGNAVLVDADLQFGDIMVHMNTRPTRTISDIVHDNGADLELLPDVLLPHNSGLKLLLSPPQPALADAVTPATLSDVADSLRQKFSVVVVDTCHKLDDKTLAILDKSDYILFVTTPELPAIKSAKQFYDLARELEYDLDRIGLVINRANLPGGIQPDKIQKILKVDRADFIPYDPRLLLAINRGVILTQQDPNSALARSVRALAEKIGQKFLAGETTVQSA
ncbi:MAG: response regulator [Chloroflexi bacterium]|nr:MAG: response regulator [Chloroflexota bacterium]